MVCGEPGPKLLRHMHEATAAPSIQAAALRTEAATLCIPSPDLFGLKDKKVEVASQLRNMDGELGGCSQRLALGVVEGEPGRAVGLLLLGGLLAPTLEEHKLDEPASTATKLRRPLFFGRTSRQPFPIRPNRDARDGPELCMALRTAAGGRSRLG